MKLIFLQDGPHSISKAVETFSNKQQLRLYSLTLWLARYPLLCDYYVYYNCCLILASTNSLNNLTKSFIATDNSLMDPSLSYMLLICVSYLWVWSITGCGL